MNHTEMVFVKSPEQLCIIQNQSDKTNYKFVPLMPNAALAMVENGFPDVHLPIALLNSSERNSIWGEAIELSKKWHNSFPDMKYLQVDVHDCCRLQMLGFFQDVIAAEKIFHRLIEDHKPQRALFFNQPSRPSYGNAVHDGTSDIFEAVLQWRFVQAGIEVCISQTSSTVNFNLKMRVWEILKRIVPKFKKVVAIRQHSFISKRKYSLWDTHRIRLCDIPTNKPLVVGCGASYDLLVIWPYLKAIAKELGGYPLLINENDFLDTKTLRSGLFLDPDLRFIYAADISDKVIYSSNIAAQKELCIASLSDGTLLPPALQNPNLRFQFECFWDKMVPDVLTAAQRAFSFFEKFNVAIYLDDWCAGHANRAWVSVGNLIGVTTATMPHGAVNVVEFHDFNAKWAFAWGELNRQNLMLASPDKKDRIIITGNHSIEMLQINKGCELLAEPRSVLLITGGFCHQVWTDMDLDRFLTTWEDFSQIAANRPDIQFIIKPHPSVRDLAPWYRKFISKSENANMYVVNDRKVEDILPGVMLAVMVGKPGTAGLIAVLAEIPCVYYDNLLCREVVGYRIWNEGNGIPRLTCASQLAQLIDKIKANPSERDQLIECNRRFISLYLHPFRAETICNQIKL